MVELSTFDIWFYVFIGIVMSLGGFFIFHYYQMWAKRQLENLDSSLVRASGLILFASFGITLTGMLIIYVFGYMLISIHFK
ncbi:MULTISPECIES: hypothetical protein [Pseudoalteromonas]|uniref:Uncharacterized protein n=1 Tax=Pseudoalteromonas luteoviolacea (strain 2ta16) TaxID=1353533 RepID=V4I330_PSEL2|nr:MULTISPECIES: hypothetical protein [Pseudoalteromonas]ESP94644.1 hypothetical protein PL2TA16_00644 [Pseudoalteromonas luteoviolacea 2ta16]KZN32343.1 hypothetical protein N483_04105 [Pseudoalteromonas luteoviolacea NCIMB 1944]MCG7547521.1 hypothetical protein [Pseudoalteromonas sp. Of7M-16]